MHCLIISTTVYPVPLQGYGGLEQLVFQLVCGLATKGHTISVVCPEGSTLPEGIEGISTGLREDEEKAYQRYKGRLERDEWDVIVDASWQRWAIMGSVGRDDTTPIVQWHHTDPSVYQTPAPLAYNMWVGVSKSHAEDLGKHFKMPVKYVYNGVDTQFYKSNGNPRGERYLWLSRWTPEKGGAEIIGLAQKLKVGVDMFGDTEIVGDLSYAQLCSRRADGMYARISGGITREATVDAYSTHKGYLYWLNWSEPFGLSIVEAMATGCVPVVNRRGATPELIRHGTTGFLVDTLEEMEELVKSDAVKSIKPETMRRHVEKQFGIERFVADWEKLLLRVVEGERW